MTSIAHIPHVPASPRSAIPIADVQRQLIQSVLAETLDDFKSAIRKGTQPKTKVNCLSNYLPLDVQNLHLELIRQFQYQQIEMREMLEQYLNPIFSHCLLIIDCVRYIQNSQRELVEEIKALRAENTVLRQRVFY